MYTKTRSKEIQINLLLSASSLATETRRKKKTIGIDALSWPFLMEYYITSSPHGVSFSMEI
jgi:hypothetical protein